MKSAILIAILLSGFYVFAMNLVMTQVKAMEDFYSNMDQYVSADVNNPSNPAPSPPPLHVMVNP